MSVVEQFLEGNSRRYTATFKVPDAAGVATDPTTVVFYRRRLDGGSSPLETYTYGVDAVVKDATGVYHLDLSYPDDGPYVVGVEGTGVCEAYAEIDVKVGNAKARP
jgi:hypothetical protein